MKQFVCGACHDTKLVAHAMMQWDEIEERFKYLAMTGSVWCQNCQTDRGFDFVDIDEWDEVII